MDLSNLPAVLEQYREAPFEWGTLDCCMFAANVVRDLIGHDYAADFRGAYSTRHGAARLIHEHGGSLAAMIDGLLDEGFPPLMAHRGDVVLGPVPEPALGICDGAGAVFKAARGFVRIPLVDCLRCWPCHRPR